MDSLLHTFTKKGEFDKLRKSIFAKIEQSVSCKPLLYVNLFLTRIERRKPKN